MTNTTTFCLISISNLKTKRFETRRFETWRFVNLTFCKPDVLKPDILNSDVLKPDVLKPDVLWVYQKLLVMMSRHKTECIWEFLNFFTLVHCFNINVIENRKRHRWVQFFVFIFNIFLSLNADLFVCYCLLYRYTGALCLIWMHHPSALSAFMCTIVFTHYTLWIQNFKYSAWKVAPLPSPGPHTQSSDILYLCVQAMLNLTGDGIYSAYI